MSARHLALVGPTASGKSDLAMGVARMRADVEIVAIDSMQVYRGLDIGTAKPTGAEQTEVRHHMIDVADPLDEWSVARFQSEARAAIADIEARGKRAVLVGGTGLYVRAVIDPLELPPEDGAVRAALERRTADADGLAAAHAELVARDPVAAGRMQPANRRRIVRALEVIELTGRRFSSFGPGAGLASFPAPVVDVRQVGVWLPRAVAAARIDARVTTMREAGLVEEVERLAAAGRLSRTARQAIGYQEVLDHLEGREPSLEAALVRIVARTRRFARRQRMWFRRDPRITWLAPTGNPCTLVPSLLAIWAP